MIKPTALVILDGFGLSSTQHNNAIALADTPFLKRLLSHYPHTQLAASGTAVGLSENYQGNSEVGHLTIGAGRIIQQPLTIWRTAIENGTFFTNNTVANAFKHLKQENGTLHIIGLLSDAGIHSHEEDIYACVDVAMQAHIKQIVLHLFLDGRDTPPQSAYHYIKKLEAYLKRYEQHIVIGSLHGRFYAMDRNNNWDRTEKTYRIMTQDTKAPVDTWQKILEKNYAHGIYDEFIPPTHLAHNATIKNGDGIIFCNIRPDRARQLTAAFVDPQRVSFITKPLNLSFFMTPIPYGAHLPTLSIFTRPLIYNTLKDVLAHHHKTIFAIAETEKYAHVTYFFRGENEDPVATESRVMIPSLSIATYQDQPEMSANQITAAIINSLHTQPCDFYLINYANADMVGHSGSLSATIRAIECLDRQLEQLYNTVVTEMNGTLYITADHGKAEDMYDEKINQPHTAHTNNPVPFIYVNQHNRDSTMHLNLKELADIAPFILKNMELPVPAEMKHKS